MCENIIAKQKKIKILTRNRICVQEECTDQQKDDNVVFPILDTAETSPSSHGAKK